MNNNQYFRPKKKISGCWIEFMLSCLLTILVSYINFKN